MDIEFYSDKLKSTEAPYSMKLKEAEITMNSAKALLERIQKS